MLTLTAWITLFAALFSANCVLAQTLTIDGSLNTTGDITTAGKLGVTDTAQFDAKIIADGGIESAKEVSINVGGTTVLTIKKDAILTNANLFIGAVNPDPPTAEALGVYIPAEKRKGTIWWGINSKSGGLEECNDASVGCNPPQPSDVRLKTNVKTIPNALELVAQLRGVSYFWSEAALDSFLAPIHGGRIVAGPGASQAENARVQNAVAKSSRDRMSGEFLGVIAQEIAPVLPGVVADDDNGFLGVHYEQLTPVLIEAIKELRQENFALKARLTAIERQLAVADAPKGAKP